MHVIGRCRRPTVLVLVMALAVACGTDVTGTEAPEPSSRATPPATAGDGTAITDLSAIGCGTAAPTDVGELTGAWQANEGGVYYIRQVGDCVWWFGTDVAEIEPGTTGHFGFANVASGRLVGTQLDLEWADIPIGNILGAGGLTFVYDQAAGRLELTEQRGDWEPFGGTVLTRIQPEPSAGSSMGASQSP